MADSDPLVASSVYRTPEQDSQLDGRSLPRQGRDHLFSVGCWDQYGETTGSLRNPVTSEAYALKYDKNLINFLLNLAKLSFKTVFIFQGYRRHF